MTRESTTSRKTGKMPKTRKKPRTKRSLKTEGTRRRKGHAKPSQRRRQAAGPTLGHRAELTLSEWKASFEAVADPISIHDSEFNLVRVNRAFAKTVGIPAAKLMGMKCYEAIHGTPEPCDRCPHLVALKSKKPAFEEFFEPKLNMYIHVSCSPILDEKGWFIGSVHIARDITQARRAAERLLNAKQDELRVGYAAMETIPAAVILVDTLAPVIPIIYVNRAFEDMTGYTRTEVVGRNPAFLRGPHTAPVPLETIETTLSGTNFVQTEVLHYRKDGSTFWGLLRVAPVRDTTGRLTHVIETLIDTTQTRQAEMEFERQREELLLTARAGKLGELASSIAHEVNQPLTAILSNAQAAQRLLAVDQPDLAEVGEILKDIVEDNKRAGEVIRRLRTLLKKKELEFELVDVNKLIRETVELVNSDAIIRSRIIQLDLDESAPPVRGDWVQLQQVLLNLIMNGLDAMVESGADARELWVLSRQGTDGVTVEVKDSGTGIPENKIALIFRHFFTTKRDGMGMGLPISRSIIQAHGGGLVVKNNPDRGATFYFTLPAYAEE